MAGPLPRRMCDPQSLPLRGFHAGLLGQGRGSGLCRLAVDQFLQLLAGLEVGDAPRRHVHPVAGLRVAALARQAEHSPFVAALPVMLRFSKGLFAIQPRSILRTGWHQRVDHVLGQLPTRAPRRRWYPERVVDHPSALVLGATLDEAAPARHAVTEVRDQTVWRRQHRLQVADFKTGGCHRPSRGTLHVIARWPTAPPRPEVSHRPSPLSFNHRPDLVDSGARSMKQLIPLHDER